MAKRKTIASIEEGDAFAIPLKKGLYVGCRVIRDAGSDANKRHKKTYRCGDAILVACCSWFGTRLPKAKELSQFSEVLRLTHHWFKDEPLAGWIDEALPSKAVHVGVVPPRDSEVRLGRKGSLGWSNLKYQSLEQWNWSHDRDSVTARDQAEEERNERRDKQWQTRDKKLLKLLTLEQLSKHRFLRDWESPVPDVAIRKSRKLLRDTARRLIALGDAPSATQRLEVLQACIEEFNTLDARYGFIDTTEREDLCDAFDLIVRASGFTRRKNLADKWREW